MKKLIVIVGPTAIGKTAFAIEVAQLLGTEILSCDSRQFYQELNIGVARPTAEELSAVRHHFIACRSIIEPYNAYTYEQEALQLLEHLFKEHDVVVAVGGSGLYVDALCKGINFLPDPSPELRERLSLQIKEEGVEGLLNQLQELDPDYYAIVDKQNPIRIQRALETILTAGTTYTSLLQKELQPRSFQIEKYGLQMERSELRMRIDRRVDMMVESGLVEEVLSVEKYRGLNTLNTVGYKELFAYFDGTKTLTQSLNEIKNHTWQYAKKQMTWLKRYPEIQWVNMEKKSELLQVFKK